MLLFRLFIVGIFAVFMCFVSQKSFASDNGIIRTELADAAVVGMGDAFVGDADRPSAVYYNPAGITQMETAEVSAGLNWVQPHIKYESSAVQNGPNYTANMKEDNYIFPDVFITSPIFKDKLFVGLGESTDFGGGNDWEANGFSQYSTVKDSIEDKDVRLVVAYKITDRWSIAAGPVDDQSKFEHDQAINQNPAPNGDTSFKANDNAWGFDLGTIFRLNDQNQFGLEYKSPIHHHYDGSEYFNNLYTGAGLGALFGVSSFSTKATQKLTLPQSATFGYSLKPTEKLTLNFDLEWTDWTQYRRQTINYPNLTPTQQGALASASTSNRDWASVWSESVGVQYAVTDKLRLRTGYEHHQTPVPENNFDTEFPDSDSNAVTFGVGYDITKNISIDIAYVADFYQSRNVVNTVGNGSGAFLSGKYSAFVNVGTMTLTYKF